MSPGTQTDRTELSHARNAANFGLITCMTELSPTTKSAGLRAWLDSVPQPFTRRENCSSNVKAEAICISCLITRGSTKAALLDAIAQLKIRLNLWCHICYWMVHTSTAWCVLVLHTNTVSDIPYIFIILLSVLVLINLIFVTNFKHVYISCPIFKIVTDILPTLPYWITGMIYVHISYRVLIFLIRVLEF